METPIDRAAAAMQAAPEDDALRLRFFERIADAELFLLLAAEADGDLATPQVFPLDGAEVVLAFDREDRLAGFAGGPAPYAALSGRALVGRLAGAGTSLGLNFGVALSEMLIPAEDVDWLADVLSHRPGRAEERPQEFHAPHDIPEVVVAALSGKLAAATGMAEAACLAGVRYGSGRTGHMLAFLGAREGAEEGLAQAVAEALTFSGIEAGELDVAFLAPGDRAAAALSRVAIRFDLASPSAEAPAPRMAPGSDPDRPPRLR
jgi:hypothetical protein